MTQRVVLFITLFIGAAMFARGVAQTATSVYSAAQAKRGESTYQQNCVSCHGTELGGSEGGPPLAGDDFSTGWKGKKLSELFDLIKATMPQTAPGSLSDQQYADVLAFILSKNTFPAGSTDLPSRSEKLSDLIYTAN